jgi:hypothetical protein
VVDDKKETEAIVTTTLSAITSASVTLALTNNPAAAIGALAAPSAVLLTKALVERIKGRGRTFTENLLRSAPDRSVDEVSAELEENINKPWVRDTLLELLKKLDEALDDAVLPVLAKLGGEYSLVDRKAPDPFFRGFARVLCELTAEELTSLQTLIRTVAAARFRGPDIELQFIPSIPAESDAPEDSVAIELPEAAANGSRSREMLPEPVPHTLRLFHLLKSHNLGRDNPSGFYGITSGPQVLRISRDVVERLHRLLT